MFITDLIHQTRKSNMKPLYDCMIQRMDPRLTPDKSTWKDFDKLWQKPYKIVILTDPKKIPKNNLRVWR